MKKKPLTEVRWGVIGAGKVCEVKSGPAFNLVDNSHLVAIMRRSADKSEDYAIRHNIPKWYTNADKLLANPDINTIYIATPPDTHSYYTFKAAAAGKHVYVEKPMARTGLECLEMINACRKANVKLFVAYYRRKLPYFLKIKELINSGVIGEIRFVEIKLIKGFDVDFDTDPSNWRVNPEIAGGGYFYDLASHQLDYLDYVFGPIAKIFGFSSNQLNAYETEDIVTCSFHFKNGVIGQGIWAFNTSALSKSEVTRIVGSKGQISFSFFDKEEFELDTVERGKEAISFPLPKHIQQPLIDSIVKDLLNEGRCPSTGETAMRTNKVMEQVIKNRRQSKLISR